MNKKTMIKREMYVKELVSKLKDLKDDVIEELWEAEITDWLREFYYKLRDRFDEEEYDEDECQCCSECWEPLTDEELEDMENEIDDQNEEFCDQNYTYRVNDDDSLILTNDTELMNLFINYTTRKNKKKYSTKKLTKKSKK